MAQTTGNGTPIVGRELHACNSPYTRIGSVVPRGRKSPDEVTGLAGAPLAFIALCIRDPRLGIALSVTIEGCWEWTGKTVQGYGATERAGRGIKVHRYVYETYHLVIAPGLQLDHLCRNRLCCNPAHLEPVTPRVNTLRSTSPSALNAIKTHCPRGHPYAGANLRVGKRRRYCRTCSDARVRAYRERAKCVVTDDDLGDAS